MSTPPKLNNDEADFTPRLSQDERLSASGGKGEVRPETTRRSLLRTQPSLGRNGLHPDMWDAAIKKQKGLTSFNPDLIPDSEPLDSGNDKFIGTTFIDKYKVTELLGRGGMGAVYKAVHIITGKAVAIKMMHAHLVTDFNIFRRFQQEATAASRLNHANAINIHDLGMSDDGRPYLIMDYLEGKALSTMIKRGGGFPVDVCLHIFSQACAALSEAHRHGVVHRDVKPSNIMILHNANDPYFVKVVDFGIAKVFPQEGDPTVKDTTTGELFGSPPYMSPEQCLGKKLDARSDIYSMGCLMYEALTGEPPLVGSNALGTMYRQINEMPKPLSEIESDVRLTQRLDEIILKCMQKNPDQRYQDIADLKKDLDSASDLAKRKFAALAQVGLKFSGAYRASINRLGSSKKLVIGLILSVSVLSIFIIYGVTPLFSQNDPENRSVEWQPLAPVDFQEKEVSFNIARNITPPLSTKRVLISRKIGDFYSAAQKYDSALLNYAVAKDTARQLSPGALSAEDWSAIYGGAARAYWQQGKLPNAQAAARQAFNLLRQANLGGSAESLQVACILADSLDATGDRGANSFFELVAKNYDAIAQKAGNAEKLPGLLSFLGDYDFKHGNYSQSVNYYRQALAKWSQNGEAGNFNVAVAHNKIGLADLKEGNNADAVQEFKQAAQLFAQVGGADDSSRAVALYNFADASWRQFQMIESMQAKAEARRIWKSHQVPADNKKK